MSDLEPKPESKPESKPEPNTQHITENIALKSKLLAACYGIILLLLSGLGVLLLPWLSRFPLAVALFGGVAIATFSCFFFVLYNQLRRLIEELRNHHD